MLLFTPFVETESLGHFGLMNLPHKLHLQKMIAAAQRGELRQAALPGAFGDGRWIGPSESAASFGEFGIVRFSVTVLDHPPSAGDQNIVQLLLFDFDEAGRAGTAGPDTIGLWKGDNS